jgi:hypothetical protein
VEIAALGKLKKGPAHASPSTFHAARISVQATADYGRRIRQIDGAVEKSTAKGRANAAMQLAADQRSNRAELANQRDQANKLLAQLKTEKAKIDGDNKMADADLGPIRVLATLIGAPGRPALVHPGCCPPARSSRGPATLGRDKTLISALCAALIPAQRGEIRRR